MKDTVDKIIDNLIDRGGFDGWWGNLDDDIQDEIKEEIEKELITMLSEMRDKNNGVSECSICACGTEEYAEDKPRKDGLSYCSKCNKPF